MVESTQNGDGRPDDSDRTQMLTLIAEVGDALNRSSYPNPETAKVIREICDAYDYDISAEVFPTYVLALDQKEGLTELVKTGPSFRFDQVADTETLVHRLRLGALPAGEALEHLRAIVNAKPPLNPVVRIIGYMLMALGFALCFRMSFAASLAAVLIAIPIGAISLWGSVKGTLAALMPVLLTFISALVLALWAVHEGFPDPVRVAVIPVLTLIPGAALTTALIELTAGAMISGSARLVYALVVLLSMAFGLALAIDLAGMTSENLQDLTTTQAPWWVLWIAPPIYGLGNILYFCTPKRVWFWLVVVAFGAFWFNQALEHAMHPQFAGGVSLGVALLAAWGINAHVKGNPSVLVMFLPTFWLLVPGSMGFVAISGAITEDKELSSLGGSAALSLLSMAICMMIASVLAPMVTTRYKGALPA